MTLRKSINKKTFKILRLVLFFLATSIIAYSGYYFPKIPPLVRTFIIKNRVNLARGTAHDVNDKRFLEWFNRDPERNIPLDSRIVVSPADGYIVAVGLREGKKHILIEMRYTDVHVQRVPVAGRVLRVEGEGKRLPQGFSVGDYTLEKLAPYQKWTILETEIGEVVVRQITSAFANRIEVFVREGQYVERGQRLGRVLAGSNVVLELPLSVELIVKVGQDVIGGETIVAKY